MFWWISSSFTRAITMVSIWVVFASSSFFLWLITIAAAVVVVLVSAILMTWSVPFWSISIRIHTFYSPFLLKWHLEARICPFGHQVMVLYWVRSLVWVLVHLSLWDAIQFLEFPIEFFKSVRIWLSQILVFGRFGNYIRFAWNMFGLMKSFSWVFRVISVTVGNITAGVWFVKDPLDFFPGSLVI